MENKEFKVVGVQLIPKNKLGERKIIHQIADVEVEHSEKLFEKMIRPVNQEFEDNLRYEDSKSKSKKVFSVVGLVNFSKQSGMPANMQINSSLFYSLNIFDELNALVRTVN